MLNIFSPASENVPMIRTRIIQTMTATITGTARVSVVSPTRAPPMARWFKMAMETPHQVERGVEAGCQQPGAEQVPDLGRLLTALLRGEEAGDAGKVDAAEGDGEHNGPAQPRRLQVAEHVGQGELGGGVVEDLEGDERQDQDKAKNGAAPRNRPSKGGKYIN